MPASTTTELWSSHMTERHTSEPQTARGTPTKSPNLGKQDTVGPPSPSFWASKPKTPTLVVNTTLTPYVKLNQPVVMIFSCEGDATPRCVKVQSAGQINVRPFLGCTTKFWWQNSVPPASVTSFK